MVHANERACLVKESRLFWWIAKVFYNNYEIESIFEVFNVAYGENTTLNEYLNMIKTNLGKFNKEIKKIEPIYGSIRQGDVPHSLASVEKAKSVLGYKPEFNAEKGFELVCEWY